MIIARSKPCLRSTRAALLAVFAWVVVCTAVVAPVTSAHGASPKHRALVERVEWEMSDAGASVIVVVKGRVDYQSRFAPADATTGLPPRAYVDLHPAQLGDQISREPLIVDDRLVRRIRLGQFDKDTVRVVLDLSRPARLRVEIRDRPSRLMLRLARGEGDGAVADAGEAAAPAPPDDVVGYDAKAERAARRREAELARKEQAEAEAEARAAREREFERAERARAEIDAQEARRRDEEIAERRRAEAEAAERAKAEALAARQREAELAEQRRVEAEALSAQRREAEALAIARRDAEIAERKRADAEARAARERAAELARSEAAAKEAEQPLADPRRELEPARGWDDARLALRPRTEPAPSDESMQPPPAVEAPATLSRSDEAEERPRPTPGGAARSPPLLLADGAELPRETVHFDPSPPPLASEPRPLATERHAQIARIAPPGPTADPKTVVIDPGHGGKDPGAQGAFGVPEKDVTLALAYLIKEKLEEGGGVRVVLTRKDDRYVSLEERTATANAQGAELFVSVHANASESDSLSGIETYTLNNTDDRATIRLAALENGLTLAGATPGEQDLAYILSDLVQTGKEDESTLLARAVQSELVRYLRGRWKSVSDLGVKKGPFYVLVGAYMPCVLVEVGFLTHPVEGPRMATHRYQRDIADGVAEGIRRFLAAPPPGANL